MSELGSDGVYSKSLKESERETSNESVVVHRLVSSAEVAGCGSFVGYSKFAAGTVSRSLRHDCEEVAFVTSGSGRVLSSDSVVSFSEQSVVYIPAGAWHAIESDGARAVEMVFFFPHESRPKTEGR